jgi:hypothetical protein
MARRARMPKSKVDFLLKIEVFRKLHMHASNIFLNVSGGKGDSPADASKVKAFGPGLEKGKVLPGVPANFTIDSSKTGPASIDVDITGISL